MKTLALLSLPIALFAFSALAEETCYEFDVSKNSQNIPKIEIQVADKGPKQKHIATAIVTASNDKNQNTKTSFSCRKKNSIWSCNNPDGAGDFKLDPDTKVKLKFAYINLSIGSTGSFSHQEDEEITEEFALYDRSIDKNGDEESEDDSGELEEIEIAGKTIVCKAPTQK